MSVLRVNTATLQCDGDGRWPCQALFQEESFCSARETRQSARREGWEVNIRQPQSRTRLDFCPKHATATVSLT